MKTTNYFNTFIEVAEDCPVNRAEIPPEKAGDKTIAKLQYEMIKNHPYQNTSDDVIFSVHAVKNSLETEDLAMEREKFFSKGQPCFRSSPLAKRYGWGIHSDENGKIAIYKVDSEEYNKLIQDKSLKHLKAMRSKRQK